MADQAAVRHGGAGNGTARLGPEAAARGVVGNIAELGNDVATLAELQAKLTLIDLKEGTSRALIPTIVAAIAAVLALSSVPVALIGLAFLLARALGRDQEGWAFLIVAGSTLILAGVAAAIAALRLGRSFESLRRSREELTRNLAWIRTVLVHSGRLSTRYKP